MLVAATPAMRPRHGQEFSPAPAAAAPVAESRGPELERWGNEGADHHDLTPDFLRPRSPEKNAPRAGESRSGRKGRGDLRS